jgi:hypothetical protein
VFRMVALVAGWSHDYWSDINDEGNEEQTEDVGPSRHSLLLVKSWSDRPSSADLVSEVSHLEKGYLTDLDGHHELHSHVVVEDEQWEAMLSASEVSMGKDLTEHNAPSAAFSCGRWRPISLITRLQPQLVLQVLHRSGADPIATRRGMLPLNSPALTA